MSKYKNILAKKRKKVEASIRKSLNCKRSLAAIKRRYNLLGSAFFKYAFVNIIYHLFPNDKSLHPIYKRRLPGMRDKLKTFKTDGYKNEFIGRHLMAKGIKKTFKFLKDLYSTEEKSISNNLNQTLLDEINKIYEERNFCKLEEKIGYKFGNRALLLQAFCHRSFKHIHKIGCYKRLEFFGDAILEFATVRYFYHHRSNYNYKQISIRKLKFLSNKSFTKISKSFGLEQYILCDPSCKLSLESKVYADIFESMAAAIFIDCGMDFNIFWEIFYDLMRRPILLDTIPLTRPRNVALIASIDAFLKKIK